MYTLNRFETKRTVQPTDTAEYQWEIPSYLVLKWVIARSYYF